MSTGEPAPKSAKVSIEITRPDDWHHHFRDDARLGAVTRMASKQFARAIAMPNLVPPVTTTEDALAYYERIVAFVPEKGPKCEPLMTLYLTDNTPPEEIVKAKESGKVVACKLYPAGATTNSDSGVTDISKIIPTLQAMADNGILLLVHGEVTDQCVDIFDREKQFIDEHLRDLVKKIPTLKIVMEHITTKDAVDFVMETPSIAATITCHHLLYNRNAIFKGGLNPHKYCLPVLKRELHRQALLGAIKSGSKRFFLGTDSAPHEQKAKEASCACAGCFTSHAAVELYAQAFEEADCMEHFEAFAAFNGPDYYGLPRNTEKITLVKESWKVDSVIELDDGKGKLIPFNLGEEVQWKILQ